MIKRWFNSKVQTDVIEIDCEGARGTVQTIEGISKPSKFIMIRLPGNKNEIAEIMLHNLTDIEKEVAFDVLDYELHDETYESIKEKAVGLECENERLKEEIQSYEERVEEYSRYFRV
ncbi:MAG: hypothetical protein E7211_09745 [Clostridium lundense]|nr:hypothetical protein [Clostridium lundense]